MPNANLVAARNQLRTLVSIYNSNFDQYQQATYNETQVRVDFVNPFFQLLGWDVLNEAGLPQHLREVTHEATVLVEENGAHRSKKPDYSFKVGTEILFFLETKKPSVNITADRAPSFQLRRYGWSGNLKVFQRHAVIVGSTGSGKSWCVAKILEQVAELKSADALLFDIHGEYSTLEGDNFTHLKVAGPNDTISEGILFLPYWLLTYEEMLSLMLDRSDNNAPNQAMMFSNQVIKHKKDFLHGMGLEEMEANITLDSPIPYSLDKMIDCLTALDQEMVPGARAGAEKKGPYNGQLTRFIQRLETKRKDKRLNFMFSREESLLKYDYMDELCCKLMLPAQNGKKGVKIIDFSEVPSDILPLIVSLIARVVFSVQQWSQVGERHPIAIFCDEAHLYIPAHTEKSIDDASLVTFERISKEGRKYGVGLVVISQRPSEVNRTVLSQSNNFIAMRLTNADDQAVVKRLLPDSLGDYAEMLPILDIGEALIVGDASLLPSRIRIAPPKLKPRSATIDFWDEWAKETSAVNIRNAIEALRKQSK